jgi:hypothetical protein
MGRKRPRVYDTADYRRRRKLLLASAHPGSKCGRCGLLLHQHRPHKSGRLPTWQAGHLLGVADGGGAGPLVLEASTCNQTAGAREGHWKAFGRHRENGGARASEPRTAPPHNPMHYSPDGWSPCREATGALCEPCRAYHGKKG